MMSEIERILGARARARKRYLAEPPLALWPLRAGDRVGHAPAMPNRRDCGSSLMGNQGMPANEDRASGRIAGDDQRVMAVSPAGNYSSQFSQVSDAPAAARMWVILSPLTRIKLCAIASDAIHTSFSLVPSLRSVVGSIHSET